MESELTPTGRWLSGLEKCSWPVSKPQKQPVMSSSHTLRSCNSSWKGLRGKAGQSAWMQSPPINTKGLDYGFNIRVEKKYKATRTSEILWIQGLGQDKKRISYLNVTP